jgi:Transposase DDE domain group 1
VGEKESEPFRFTFNGVLKVGFQGSRVTSDAGLILVRELDERLGLEAIITEHLSDSRQGLNTQFRLPDLLRQSIYSRLAGYEDLNDAQRLRRKRRARRRQFLSLERHLHGCGLDLRSLWLRIDAHKPEYGVPAAATETPVTGV